MTEPSPFKGDFRPGRMNRKNKKKVITCPEKSNNWKGGKNAPIKRTKSGPKTVISDDGKGNRVSAYNAPRRRFTDI